jgi:hypothetical protein
MLLILVTVGSQISNLEILADLRSCTGMTLTHVRLLITRSVIDPQSHRIVVFTLADEHMTSMINILSKSQATIHTLSLPVDDHTGPAASSLWMMRFPHLRSLTLGYWVRGSGPGDFADFILAHSDTIEELDVERGGFFEPMIDENSWPRFQTSSLPHLRLLRAHPSMFKAMAYARMHCLRTTLSRLAVGSGGLKGLFNAVLSPEIGRGPAIGQLLALREIELNFFKLKWDDEVAEVIRQCARCCSLLEVWRGILDFPVNAEVLGEVFGLFENLRVIYLREDVILGTESQSNGDDEVEEDTEESEEDTDGSGDADELEEDTDGLEGDTDGLEEETNRSWDAVELEGTTDDEIEKEIAIEWNARDAAAEDSRIEAYVGTIALSCRALQGVSVRRRCRWQEDWWTINRTCDGATPASGLGFTLSREECDVERPSSYR